MSWPETMFWKGVAVKPLFMITCVLLLLMPRDSVRETASVPIEGCPSLCLTIYEDPGACYCEPYMTVNWPGSGCSNKCKCQYYNCTLNMRSHQCYCI
jgi:hypothetical protein